MMRVVTVGNESNRIIFAGRDTTLLSHCGFRSGTIHVTFSHRFRDYSTREGFGANFFTDRGLNAVHYVAHWSHWWQTDEVRLSYESVLKFILAEYSNVVLYGVSMGASGALAYSSMLGAHKVICICPILTVRPALTAYDNRWTKDLAHVDFVHDELAGVSRTAQITVLYDPFEARDAGHVRLLKSLRGFDEVRLPFAGHGATAFLKEIGALSFIVSTLIDGSFDNKDLRRRINENKRRSYRYWMYIIDRLVTRGSVDLVRKSAVHFVGMLEEETNATQRRYFIRKSTPYISRALAFIGDAQRLRQFSKNAIRFKAINSVNAGALSEAFFNISDYNNALKFGLIAYTMSPKLKQNICIIKKSYQKISEKFNIDVKFYSYLASLGLLRAHFQPAYDALLEEHGDRTERERLSTIIADHVQQRVARGLRA